MRNYTAVFTVTIHYTAKDFDQKQSRLEDIIDWLKIDIVPSDGQKRDWVNAPRIGLDEVLEHY